MTAQEFAQKRYVEYALQHKDDVADAITEIVVSAYEAGFADGVLWGLSNSSKVQEGE